MRSPNSCEKQLKYSAMVEGILMCDFSSYGGSILDGEQTANLAGILWGVVGTRCRVSYLDSRNIEHAVDVTADSLFEAVAVAVRAFQEGALLAYLPGAGLGLGV